MMNLQDKTTEGQNVSSAGANLEHSYEQFEDEELTSGRCGLQAGGTPAQELDSSAQQMYAEVCTTQSHNPQVGSMTTHVRTIQHNNIIYKQTDSEVPHGKEEKPDQETETETTQL